VIGTVVAVALAALGPNLPLFFRLLGETLMLHVPPHHHSPLPVLLLLVSFVVFVNFFLETVGDSLLGLASSVFDVDVLDGTITPRQHGWWNAPVAERGASRHLDTLRTNRLDVWRMRAGQRGGTMRADRVLQQVATSEAFYEGRRRALDQSLRGLFFQILALAVLLGSAVVVLQG